MKVDSFETLVAEFKIRPLKQEFKTVITEFFDAVVKSIVAYQPEFIGHLKGVCQGQGTDYFQISYVSAQTGVQIKSQWSHNPESARFTLNLITLGIDYSRMNSILNEIVLRDEVKETIKRITI